MLNLKSFFYEYCRQDVCVRLAKVKWLQAVSASDSCYSSFNFAKDRHFHFFLLTVKPKHLIRASLFSENATCLFSKNTTFLIADFGGFCFLATAIYFARFLFI